MFSFRTLLKEIILWVSDPALRQFVVNYVTKHSGSEVAPYLNQREIRNKALFQLCLSILNDNVFDMMMDESPINPVTSVAPSDFTVSYKRLFEQQLSVLKKYQEDPEIVFACPSHGVVKKCPNEENPVVYSSLLRIHYWYFVVMGNNTYIRNPDHRQLGLLWSQLISVMFMSGCGVLQEEAVTLMMGLAVCSTDFELKPPFISGPVFPLKPLKQMKVKGYEESSHDPTSLIAQQFISSMPDIKDGAFAFISVSKDLFQRCDNVDQNRNEF